MARILGLLLMLMATGACSGPTATPAPTREPVDPGYITEAAYGDEWPFLISAGTLRCDPSGKNDGRLLVRFDTGDGIEYALNGQAKDFGYPRLDATILKDYPSEVGILPLIERGLRLCD